MSQQFVTFVNRVNNAAIRRIKNERGDLVYVVPSYTLPDNCVMNGGLYPADEIASAYKSLEGTPAPCGHPMDSQGNFILANSADGIIYYQCGIFNKNVQRVEDDKYGARVYVEKHIHINTAMQTERGRRIIDAIDAGEAIHTSTGVLLDRVDEQGIAVNGKEYTWKAVNMTFDHDAILLDEEGAATPSDGVGMMVNHNLFTKVNRDGQTLAVNSAVIETNQSFNDLREMIQTKIQEKFGDDESHLWLVDFGDDYVIFENGETAYRAKYMRDEESVMIDDEAQEVKRKTLWETVASGVRRVLTSPFVGLNNNQEGKDMAFKDMIKKRLGDKYEDNMSDDDMLNAYDQMMKGNAAEEAKTEGEQAKPEVEANLEQLVADAVAKALAANAKEKTKAEKARLVDELKANGVEFEQADIDSMTVNALQIMLTNSAKPKPAFGLAGNSNLSNDDMSFDTLPE